VDDDDGTFQKVADNGSNMVKGWSGLGCLDHTIERSVLLMWKVPAIQAVLAKAKRVVTFFNASTIGNNELGRIHEELTGKKMAKLVQEVPTRWSSLHAMGRSLAAVQHTIQTYLVKEKIKSDDGKDLKMDVEDWEILGESTASLNIIAAIVKQAEGDEYTTAGVALPFLCACMNSLSEDAVIQQSWLREGDLRRELPASSCKLVIQQARALILNDFTNRWVTKLSEKKKKFYLISSQLDPRFKMLKYCDGRYFPASWKQDGIEFLRSDFTAFYSALPSDVAGVERQNQGGVQIEDMLGDLLGGGGRWVSILCARLAATVIQVLCAAQCFRLSEFVMQS
jgi:hypothetical protein